jgi:hypothetical protein
VCIIFKITRFFGLYPLSGILKTKEHNVFLNGNFTMKIYIKQADRPLSRSWVTLYSWTYYSECAFRHILVLIQILPFDSQKIWDMEDRWKFWQFRLVQFDLWGWSVFFMSTLSTVELVCKCSWLFKMKLINENMNSYGSSNLRALYFNKMGCSGLIIQNKAMWSSSYDESIKRSNKPLYYKKHSLFDFK